MVRKYKKQKSSRKKLWFVALAVVVGFVVFVGAISLKRLAETDNTAQNTSTQRENELGRQVTDQKGSDSAQVKEPSAGSTKQSTGDIQAGQTAANPGANVKPIVTYFGKKADNQAELEINAFVPDIIESGNCTLTITNGSTVIITQVKPAHPNVQSTRCEPFVVSSAGSSANWRAVVSYNSSAHNGSSDPAALQN